jgi:hypothetical protein
MCWANWFYPWSSLFVTVPMKPKRDSPLLGGHKTSPSMTTDSSSEAASTEQYGKLDESHQQESHTGTELEGSATAASTTRTSKPLHSLPYLPPIGSTATRIRGTSLTRLDTSTIRHTRSASVPNQPFISARPVSIGRNRSFTPGSAEDKTDRWYALSYHSPISPHPAPQTPLPPLPTEIVSPEQQAGFRLEPLEESPVLPKHPYHGPASPRPLAS